MGNKEWKIIYLNRNPWRPSYENAKNRCSLKGKYYKFGIKFLMDINDFKFLWFRNKAYLMKKPSIDRKDNKLNYTLDNCQFIEHCINSGKRIKAKKYLNLIKE